VAYTVKKCRKSKYGYQENKNKNKDEMVEVFRF